MMTRRTLGWMAIVVGGLIALGGGSQAASAETGICPMLGCNSGDSRCADGSITDPNGQVWHFTCYTTIHPE